MSLLDNDNTILNRTDIFNEGFPASHQFKRSAHVFSKGESFIYEWTNPNIFNKKYHGETFTTLIAKTEYIEDINKYKIVLAVFNFNVAKINKLIQINHHMIHFIKLPCEDYADDFLDALKLSHEILKYIKTNFNSFHWLFDNAIKYPNNMCNFAELIKKTKDYEFIG